MSYEYYNGRTESTMGSCEHISSHFFLPPKGEIGTIFDFFSVPQSAGDILKPERQAIRS